MRIFYGSKRKIDLFFKPSEPCHVGIHWIALSLSTLRRVPMYQGFSHFLGFLHHFVISKLAISSIQIREYFTEVKEKVINFCTKQQYLYEEFDIAFSYLNL